jgi:hypothetical protein
LEPHQVEQGGSTQAHLVLLPKVGFTKSLNHEANTITLIATRSATALTPSDIGTLRTTRANPAEGTGPSRF